MAFKTKFGMGMNGQWEDASVCHTKRCHTRHKGGLLKEESEIKWLSEKQNVSRGCFTLNKFPDDQKWS